MLRVVPQSMLPWLRASFKPTKVIGKIFFPCKSINRCDGLLLILYWGHQLNPTGYFQIRIITAATCILEKSYTNPCKAL